MSDEKVKVTLDDIYSLFFNIKRKLDHNPKQLSEDLYKLGFKYTELYNNKWDAFVMIDKQNLFLFRLKYAL
jgi:hypothetical protein